MIKFTELDRAEQDLLIETFDGIINSADKLYEAADVIFSIITKNDLETKITLDEFTDILDNCSKYTEALDELF